MQYIPSGNSSLLILDRGEELHSVLNDFAQERGLASAWLSGLGGGDNATLGFYDIEIKQYVWREFNEPFEILSLQGNLSLVDGKPFWHVHAVISGRDLQSYGGHVRHLRVGLTGELHITPLDTPLTRQHDDVTGLKLLCPL
jgi:predicted DNA-binding protein with PD1-like motif